MNLKIFLVLSELISLFIFFILVLCIYIFIKSFIKIINQE